MASLSNTRRPEVARAARPAATAQRRALARQAGGAPAAATPGAGQPAMAPAGAAPAYLQAKLAMSTPGDASEQQADQVATQVARSPRAGAAATAAPAVAATPATAAPVVQRASLAPGAASQAVEEIVPVPAARDIQRVAAPAGATDPAVQPAVASGTEERIQARLGRGAPLAQDTRADMQARFAQDFSQVRIHTDAEADALCATTQARAFTVGNDVFFAAGEYAPASDAGRELLAHELTHVVQQGGNTTGVLARDDTPANASGSGTAGTAAAPAVATNTQGDRVDTSSQTIAFATLPIPGFKGQAHRGDLYRGWNLRRNPRYNDDTRPSNQQAVWRNNISTTTVEGLLRDRAAAAQAQPLQGQYVFRGPARPIIEGEGRHAARGDVNYFFGAIADIAKAVSTPSWNRRGSRSASMEVDHIVECQISGHPEPTEVNLITNMELMERRPNGQSGNFIRQAVDERVDRVLSAGSPTLAALEAHIPGLPATQTLPRRRALIKSAFTLQFSSFTTDETPRGGTHSAVNENSFWSRTQIEAGEHLDPIVPANFADLGRAGHIAIFPNRSGGVSKSFVWDGSSNAPSQGNSEHTWLKPFTITAKRFFTGEQGNLWLGELDIEIPSTDTRFKPMQSTVYIERLPGTDQAGTLQKQSVQRSAERLEKKQLSPLTVSDIEIPGDSGLLMQGEVLPSIPLISNARLQYRVDGDDLSIFSVLQGPDLSFPGPINVTQSALTLFYSTRQGIGMSGRAELAVDNLGTGYLEGSASTDGGFALSGGFDFDSRLFDRSHIEAWYRDEHFGASGELAITNPDKIRGIRSAAISASFEEGVFSASGTVEPDIPGVQQAALRVSYTEAAGLTIGGALQLAANPAIRSGSIDVTVNKLGEAWRVAATGTAQPAIPGVESQLSVAYDDGAFDARFSGAFQRGMLAGTAEVGVTNRSVDEAGQPTGAPEPGAPLIVYGAGSATLQIAPWLQGTAGIRFAPDGEVTVSGEIGLPGSLQIFGRHELHKPLFDMATQIPVFPGIVAEVGGNLSASAGIGPGALDRLAIHIDYNPAHEDATHVTGDAHLNVPADAGVRLGARAGIGLGITGASATGGIELGGSLGVAGAAEAGVHIDWTPASGLVVDAEGYLHAEPRFRFDVSGYVSVRALGFSVYDERWELAAYELGSNLRLGLRFPIHYEDGQPFDVSLDDVQFEVPDVDPAAMVRQLGAQIF